jgi:hypothetical protein
MFCVKNKIKENKKESSLNSKCVSGFCRVPTNSTGYVGLTDNMYQCVSNEFSVQSDVDIVEKQVTTEFVDQQVSNTDQVATSQMWYQPTNTADSDLKDFLSRPVNILNSTWSVGGGVGTIFDPWTLFLSNANIQYKLHNYAFIRCDLKIKIMVNASPFYYGAFLASYNPLESVFDSADHWGLGVTVIPQSQRPHTWVFPQTNQGAEMTLPYLNITEWLPIHGSIGSTDISRMGRVAFSTLIPLKNVGISSSDVSINVYAWAENVELCGLTVDLAVQTDRDEYTGPISKVASAAARATGLLKSVPVVGDYMTATSMASQVVADVAASFGYTKVPVLERILPYKNLPFHGLATSDQPDVTEKLTVDSKNELTIDNSAIGDPTKDSLLISKFCMHNSYLTKFVWAASDASDALLWNSYVSPTMFVSTPATFQNYINGVPMFIATRMFDYWRGDIIFDFKIICSKYHKGRLRFSWDPVGDVASVPSNTQTVFNHIQDINESTTVSLRVPYIQRTSYLKVPESLSSTYFSDLALPPDASDTVNGILTVRVINEQTSPVTSADIDILVFVRAAENIEFAAPKQISEDLNFYSVQGDFDNEQEVVMGAPSNVDPNVNFVYMGESIVSFREMLQRCNFSYCMNDIVSSSISEYVSMFLNRRPLYRGFDPLGIHQAIGPVSTVAEPFNYVANTPYHLISSCFLGERGSITWKINCDCVRFKSIEVKRCKQILSSARYSPSNSSNVFDMNQSRSKVANEMVNRSFSNFGLSLMNQKTNTGVSANCPMYSIYTMLDTAPKTRTQGLTNVATTTDTIGVSFVNFQSETEDSEHEKTDFYFQTGPDHSLVFFLNVPTLFEYITPSPV